MSETEKLKVALNELLDAIDARWSGESDRKRANAISPRMEDAIAGARMLVSDSSHTRE